MGSWHLTEIPLCIYIDFLQRLKQKVEKITLYFPVNVVELKIKNWKQVSDQYMFWTKLNLNIDIRKFGEK